MLGDALGDATSRAFDAVSNRTPEVFKQWMDLLADAISQK